MGSKLNRKPNLKFGCEGALVPSYTGDYSVVPSGQPSCTWWQSGVFGDPYNPLKGYVPGNGAITRISVRSGPRPAPLRFAIVRHYEVVGGSACCFYQYETEAARPKPNAVTNFAVDLPVLSNNDGEAITADILAISANSRKGRLPIRSTGRNNALNDFTRPGSINAAFWHPKMGALPNDKGGGRRETGVPGFELTIRFTWCPAMGVVQGVRGAGCAAQVPGAQPGGEDVRLATFRSTNAAF
jgi:hypothetical protein